MKNKMIRFGKIITVWITFFLMMGCSVQDEDITPLQKAEDMNVGKDVAADIAQLRQIGAEGTVELSGAQNYYTYAPKNNELLQNTPIPCDVILEFLEGQDFQFTIIEYTVPPRSWSVIGKMTPSGELKLSMPRPQQILPDGTEIYITDIIGMHSGCELYGPGINKQTLNYSGYFDGERFYAAASFYSKCEVSWPPNELFETPVDGPVQWKWIIDVTID
jgi:hypothetical protein